MTDQQPKSKHGGFRPGAGRPKGTAGAGRPPGVPNRTAQIHMRRIQAGLEKDPWEHCVRIMHWWGMRAERLERIIAEAEKDGTPIGEGTGLDALRRAHEKVLEAAKELMPYLRPRLSAVKVTTQRLDPNMMTVEERIVVRRIIERMQGGLLPPPDEIAGAVIDAE